MIKIMILIQVLMMIALQKINTKIKMFKIEENTNKVKTFRVKVRIMTAVKVLRIIQNKKKIKKNCKNF
jgi:hypothetical protein